MLGPLFALLLSSAAAAPQHDDDDSPPPPAVQNVAPSVRQGQLRSPVTSIARPAQKAADRDGDGDDDDDDGKAQPATKIVISGRKLDVARTQINPELGATVYSFGNDTIDDRPGGETTSMATMLAQTPGVSFSGDSMTIRGSKDVQVRINNVIVPEAVSDPADHLSLRLAQTTSLITGTLPAQYGFVPAGVISIVTKNGLYRHGGELEFYAGSFGFTEPAFEYAGSFLGNSLFASGSRETGTTDVADLSGRKARDKSREIEGLAFVDRILDPNDRLSLIIGGSNQNQSIGATSLPAGSEENGDQYAVGTFQHSVEGLTLQASLFYGSGTDEAAFKERTREFRATAGTQIDVSYDTGGSNIIRGGLLGNHSRANEEESDEPASEADRTSVGAYLQDEWKLTPQLTFNPGVRVDWLRGFDSRAQIEPRASLVWTLPSGLTAHVGYARYAAIVPLDDDSRDPLPTEHDDYLDVGVQYRLGAVALGIDAYNRSVRNFLTEHQTIGTAVTDSYAFSKARLQGIELSATYSTRPLSAWVNVSLSRSQGRGLIDPSSLFAPATIVAAENWIALTSERPVTGSAGLTWRRGKLALSSTVTASNGAVRSNGPADPNGLRDRGYATVGLSAVYHAGLGGRLSDFRIDITNLANAHYRINDATSLEGGWTSCARGRAITLGVEQGF